MSVWRSPGRQHWLARFAAIVIRDPRSGSRIADCGSRVAGLVAIVIVFRRSGIELPALLIALRDLLLALELLVVFVLHAHCAADVVHDVLIGRRVVATWCFISDAVG